MQWKRSFTGRAPQVPDPTLPSDDGFFDSAPCALMLTAIDGTILRTNATFCAWTGYTADEIIGKRRLQDMLTMGGRIFHQTHWAPLLQMQGSVSEVKLDIAHRDGKAIPVLLNVIRREDGGQVFDHVSMMVVSDRNAYERELLATRAKLRELNEQLSQADRRKDEFLATLAHELRNPLTPMRNVIEIMHKAGFADQQMESLCGVMDRQVAHMTHLVEDLMDVSRITLGKVTLRKARMDLSAAVTTAIDTTRFAIDEGRHKLTTTLPDDGVLIEGDSTRLVQVVQNLIGNAAKYTPPGGNIRLSLQRENDKAVIRIRDSGIGFSKENIPRLFEMFSQLEAGKARAQGGLGIGLALVKGLVELHGGKVSASSEGEDKGSEFVVELPASGSAQTVGVAPIRKPGTAQSRRVLVVDDNVDAATTLAVLIETMGQKVRTAENAAEALKAVEEFSPQIAFLDIGLPDIDGYEVARRIRQREHGEKILLVALTGWGQKHDREQAKAAGFDRHVTKPLAFEVLNEILATEVS